MSLSSFLLTDVTVGSTYLKGAAADDSVIVGRVLAILPGIGFRVRDCDGRGHVIWNKFSLADEAAYDLADEHEVVDGACPGFPDCEFWEDNGIEPLYVATGLHINSSPTGGPPGFLTPVLVGNREVAEAKGGAYLRAWTRQMMECLSLLPSRTPGPMLRTPERSLSPLTVPDAPGRPGRLVDYDDDEPEDEDEEEVDDAATEEAEEQEDEEEEEEEEEEQEEEEEEDDEVDSGEGGPATSAPVGATASLALGEQGPKIINLLTSPNVGPIVVVFAWMMYLMILYVQSLRNAV